MGNICRSPTAEAVFRMKTDKLGLKVTIDSAGTTGAHAKDRPDQRAQKAGLKRGYSFDGIKARKVTIDDFEKFDLVLAMDNDNLEKLRAQVPSQYTEKVKLFLDFATDADESEVPDPYYGGAGGFEYVLDLVENASDGLINKIMGNN